MNERMTKQFHIILILIFSVGFVGASLLSVKMFTSPHEIQQLGKSQIYSKLRKNCLQLGQQQGFRLDSKSSQNSLRFLGGNLKNPGMTLAKSSMLLKSCAGYQMTEFCIGEDCESGADMSITMESKIQ